MATYDKYIYICSTNHKLIRSMKKTSTFALLLAVSAFLFAGTMRAGVDDERFPWIKYATGFKNLYTYDGDNPTADPVEGETRVGILNSVFGYMTNTPPPGTDPSVFKDSYFKHSLVSMYKDTMLYSTQECIDYEEMVYAESMLFDFMELITLDRGGRYAVTIGHFPDFHVYADTIDILDIPSMRVGFPGNITMRDTLKLKACVSTGYPFDMNALSGKETAKWNMQFSDNDTTFVKIAEGEKALNLKEVDRPLIAGYDTLQIIRKPEKPGVYIVEFTSDFEPANRLFKANVEDTLRATVTLDKERYVYGVDKKATVHMTLDYGYPYVRSTGKDSKPTLALSYALGAGVDTMFVSNDTLGYRRMNLEMDMPIDLELVNDSVLKADTMNVKLNVFVDFNNKCHLKTQMVMPFVTPTAVEDVKAEAVESRRYNIMGLPADERTKGIIIENGKKRLRIGGR